MGVGGHSNGFTGSGDVDGGQDTKMGGLANKFKMSPGRGAPLVGTPAVCDPGGPGGGLKIEPMDTSSTNPSPESLNRDGLQVRPPPCLGPEPLPRRRAVAAIRPSATPPT